MPRHPRQCSIVSMSVLHSCLFPLAASVLSRRFPRPWYAYPRLCRLLYLASLPTKPWHVE